MLNNILCSKSMHTTKGHETLNCCVWTGVPSTETKTWKHGHFHQNWADVERAWPWSENKDFAIAKQSRSQWGCPITRRSFGGATMHSSHPISLRLEQTTRYLRNDHAAAAQLPFSLRETVGDATNPELAAWRNHLTGWLERMVAPPRELVLWLPHYMFQSSCLQAAKL